MCNPGNVTNLRHSGINTSGRIASLLIRQCTKTYLNLVVFKSMFVNSLQYLSQYLPLRVYARACVYTCENVTHMCVPMTFVRTCMYP